MIDRYRINCSSRVLQFAPVNYDAWLADVFTTLLAGATVIMGPFGGWSSFSRLGRAMQVERVTHMTAPPSVWRHLAGRFPSLSVAVSAGEALDPATRDHIASCAGTVVNAYGPSEAAICSLTADVTASSIALGEPLDGVAVTIVPDPAAGARGADGRLRIYGKGVALGYVGGHGDGAASGRFGEDAKGRYFETADLVRVDDESDLTYCGRADRCVKRGGRLLNLERIEAAIRSVPTVRECVVLAVDRRVACLYISCECAGEPELTFADVAGRLRLWEWPDAVTAVDELPRTGTDKLARVWPTLASSSQNAELPARLAALWHGYTGSASHHQSFFDDGASSLEMMELLDRVYEQFNVDVDIVDLLDEPNLLNLERLVRAKLS